MARDSHVAMARWLREKFPQVPGNPSANGSIAVLGEIGGLVTFSITAPDGERVQFTSDGKIVGNLPEMQPAPSAGGEDSEEAIA